MEFKAYKLSYYLNAQHSMDNNIDNIHAHTFTITLYIDDLSRKGFIDFAGFNHIVNTYLGQYAGKYLNETDAFRTVSPTIENMGSEFYEHLKAQLLQENYDLIQIDICENPLRVYSISDRLYLGTKPMTNE